MNEYLDVAEKQLGRFEGARAEQRERLLWDAARALLEFCKGIANVPETQFFGTEENGVRTVMTRYAGGGAMMGAQRRCTKCKEWTSRYPNTDAPVCEACRLKTFEEQAAENSNRRAVGSGAPGYTSPRGWWTKHFPPQNTGRPMVWAWKRGWDRPMAFRTPEPDEHTWYWSITFDGMSYQEAPPIDPPPDVANPSVGGVVTGPHRLTPNSRVVFTGPKDDPKLRDAMTDAIAATRKSARELGDALMDRMRPAEPLALMNERDSDTVCVFCETPIERHESMIGAGDGAGNRFAHQLCWYRNQVKQLRAEVLDEKAKLDVAQAEAVARQATVDRLAANARQDARVLAGMTKDREEQRASFDRERDAAKMMIETWATRAEAHRQNAEARALHRCPETKSVDDIVEACAKIVTNKARIHVMPSSMDLANAAHEITRLKGRFVLAVEPISLDMDETVSVGVAAQSASARCVQERMRPEVMGHAAANAINEVLATRASVKPGDDE